MGGGGEGVGGPHLYSSAFVFHECTCVEKAKKMEEGHMGGGVD